jgi:tryptophanyl-tRNA synthetase
MTQFKDKSDQLEDGTKKGYVSAGLFTYPVLQAADILIYRANLVPVGKDQEQHLELSRNVAVRFNNQFGEYFPEPKPLFTDVPKLMSLADPTKKMSKSLGDKHYIGVFEPEESIRKKVKVAVTDVGGQTGGEMSAGVANLFTIIRACGNMEAWNSLKADYDNGALKYKDLKEAAANSLIDTLRPFRERREALTAQKDNMQALVGDLSAVARAYAEETLREVKKRTGLL